MRLLSVKTFKLEQFDSENDIPQYAILSHRWGDNEVTFIDIQARAHEHKRGFVKVSMACKQALEDGLEFVWIDTLCIDKTSSAELSEAINSMFQWYKNAVICYAYLNDIEYSERVVKDNLFARSEWFKRGWTLQELIAPQQMRFYCSQWELIGSRDNLCSQISEITKIDVKLLARDDHVPLESALSTYSVAQRMSWAAERQTTRTEDRAYSLMGLFGVNMPLLYGEGARSFTRLQEEIIKINNDLSILAWKHSRNSSWDDCSLLAYDPNDFIACQDIITSSSDVHGFDNAGLTMTNLGLKVDKPLIVDEIEQDGGGHCLAISLGCRRVQDVTSVLCLTIKPAESSNMSISSSGQLERHIENICKVHFSGHSNSRLVRVGFLEPRKISSRPEMTILRESRAISFNKDEQGELWTHVWVRLPMYLERRWRAFRFHPEEYWDQENLTFDLGKADMTQGHDKQVEGICGAVALSDNLDNGVMLSFRVEIDPMFPFERYNKYYPIPRKFAVKEYFRKYSMFFWNISTYDIDNFETAPKLVDKQLGETTNQVLSIAGNRKFSVNLLSRGRLDVKLAILDIDILSLAS